MAITAQEKKLEGTDFVKEEIKGNSPTPEIMKGYWLDADGNQLKKFPPDDLQPEDPEEEVEVKFYIETKYTKDKTIKVRFPKYDSYGIGVRTVNILEEEIEMQGNKNHQKITITLKGKYNDISELTKAQIKIQ